MDTRDPSLRRFPLRKLFASHPETLGIGENLLGTVIVKDHADNLALILDTNDFAAAKSRMRYLRPNLEPDYQCWRLLCSLERE